MKSLSILSPEGHLSGTKSPLSRGAKRSAFIRGAALALLCCVCTVGMAQSYEVPAWESFTLTNKTSSSVTNPAYQWYENGIAVNGATAAALTIAGKKVGVYVYTRTVTNADVCGASNAITVNVKVNPAATLTPTYAASTHIWTTNTAASGILHWSDLIERSDNTLCTDVNKTGGSFTTSSTTMAEWMIRKDDNDGVDRYYYTWTCATATLCDNGWRLPSQTDFDALIGLVQSNTYKNQTHTPYLGPGGNILGSHPDFAWGYGGYVLGSSLNYVGTNCYYWSSMEEGSLLAYRLLFGLDGGLNVGTPNKYYAFQVRCVKNN